MALTIVATNFKGLQVNLIKSHSRLEGLNSLRGWAAVLIVVFHVLGIHNLKIPPEMAFIPRYFGLGVPLFFVISAFSLFLSTSSRVGKDGWLSEYAIRRIMRIAPLFYTIAIFYTIYIPLQFGVTIKAVSFFGTLSFLFNLMPGQHESTIWAGWTIGVEMLFYLIIPYLLVFSKNLVAAIIILIGALIVSSIFYKFYQNPIYPLGYAYMSFLGSIGIFTYGIVGYFIFKMSVSEAAKSNLGKVLLIASIVGAAGLVFAEDRWISYVGNRSNLWGAVFALLIVSQCWDPILLITNRFASYLGTLSFGLYLCHPPIVYILKPVYEFFYAHISDGFAFALCVVTTLTIVVPTAHLASRYIEKPGINLGERLIKARMAKDQSA